MKKYFITLFQVVLGVWLVYECVDCMSYLVLVDADSNTVMADTICLFAMIAAIVVDIKIGLKRYKKYVESSN